MIEKYNVESSKGTLVSFGESQGLINNILFRLDAFYDENKNVIDYKLFVDRLYGKGVYSEEPYKSIKEFIGHYGAIKKNCLGKVARAA